MAMELVVLDDIVVVVAAVGRRRSAFIFVVSEGYYRFVISICLFVEG